MELLGTDQRQTLTKGSFDMALTAKTRREGNVTIMDLSGRITLGENTGILRDELRSLLAQGNKNIILNMKDVSYVDSAGLGELVGAYTTATNQGGAVKLLHLQGKMKDLMQITKLHTIFAIFENEQQAVQSFATAATA
jgi:anti-sigma B factor antagonist